jgi:Acyclic terpene utilisation family protein AtuA
MREMRCFGASGQLGYGVPRPAFMRGLELEPAYVGADMGSVDPGPYSLGSGEPIAGRLSRRSDLDLLLTNSLKAKVPLLIGSAGTAGAEPHLTDTVDLIRDIAHQRGLRFRMAIIRADIDRGDALDWMHAGRIRPFRGGPQITEEAIESTTHLVGQMGVEPFIRALDTGADVIVAGRACDAAVFAAAPIRAGYDPGLAMHVGKLVECTSQCAEPAGRDAVMAYLRDDHFLIESLNPARRCTPTSVAAHSLYEQANPYEVVEPGGTLDLSRSTYTAVDERVTRVAGSRWISESRYTIKLEGAARVGHRAFSMGGVRDPILIGQLREVADRVIETVRGVLADEIDPSRYEVRFRLYGLNGVLGELEPERSRRGHEAFVLIDVVGEDAEIARAVCGAAKQYFLHASYEGILGTGGNLAIPFGPDIHDGGPVYRFSVYNIAEVGDPYELFPMEVVDVDGASKGPRA